MAEPSFRDQIIAAINNGGGQTCDVEGALRALTAAGCVICPREPSHVMVEAAAAVKIRCPERGDIVPVLSWIGANEITKIWRVMVDEVAREMILRHG